MDRFVAGEDIASAITVARRLGSSGFATSVDALGENTLSLRDARRTRDEYLGLLGAMYSAGLVGGCEVSVKLSALGQGLPSSGERVALSHAWEICSAAVRAGVDVTLDMEDHTTVDSTLAIAKELRVDFPLVGTVLQSNLRRTEADLAYLSDTSTRVRLVKGAYREPAGVAYQRKADVDAAYERGIGILAGSRCYPMIATHDESMIETAKKAFARNGRANTGWELQMLYGIRTDLQRASLHGGYQVRLYVPYGVDWYAYFMRRLAERPANVAFFIRALARS